MVINCTPQSLLVAGSGRALSSSRAASSAEPSRSGSPCGKSSRQRQSRSRLARAVASTHCAPPRRSQTCSSQVPIEIVGRANRSAYGDRLRHRRMRPAAMRPSSAQQRRALSEQIRNRARLQLLVVGTGECVQVGERKTAPGRAQNAEPGHTVLGLKSARASARASIISARSRNGSSSMARKGISASRSACATGARAFRARPRTAMRYLSLAS